MDVVLIYAVLWLGLLLMLPRYSHPILAYVIAGTYIARDMSNLYLRIKEFWYIECPALHIGALVLPDIVRYQLLIFMTKHCGLTCAITLVGLVPPLKDLMQDASWLWHFPGTKEHRDTISFQRYYRPGIAYFQGPFAHRSNKQCRSTRPHSFNVRSRSCYYAIVWDMLLEVVQHVAF